MLGRFLQHCRGMPLRAKADRGTVVVRVVALVAERLRQNRVVGNLWKEPVAGVVGVGTPGGLPEAPVPEGLGVLQVSLQGHRLWMALL